MPEDPVRSMHHDRPIANPLCAAHTLACHHSSVSHQRRFLAPPYHQNPKAPRPQDPGMASQSRRSAVAAATFDSVFPVRFHNVGFTVLTVVVRVARTHSSIEIGPVVTPFVVPADAVTLPRPEAHGQR